MSNFVPIISSRYSLQRSFAILFLSFFVLNIAAQTVPDFSGEWLQDKSKSDDFYRKFNVKCNIIQTIGSLTVKITFSDDSGKEMVTRENTFSLDGKVITDQEGAKKSAKLSTDNKTLILSDTRDYGGDIVGYTASYSISENGLELTVITSDIKPGVRTVKQIFDKKK